MGLAFDVDSAVAYAVLADEIKFRGGDADLLIHRVILGSKHLPRNLLKQVALFLGRGGENCGDLDAHWE
jgi:hypothetical protein